MENKARLINGVPNIFVRKGSFILIEMYSN